MKICTLTMLLFCLFNPINSNVFAYVDCEPYSQNTNPNPVLPCSCNGYDYDSLAVESYVNSFFYHGANYILNDFDWWWSLQSQVNAPCDGLMSVNGGTYNCSHNLSFNKSGALFFGVGPKAEYILVGTGAEWRYSAVEEVGWSEMGFDDSQWNRGITPFDDHSVTGWCNFGENGTHWPINSTLHLRKILNVDQQTDLKLQIAIDNDIEIYLDGNLIVSVSSEGCPYRWNYEYDIPSVNAGSHLIAVKIIDRGADNGFDLVLSQPNVAGIWTPSPPMGQIHNSPMEDPPGTTFTQSGTGFTPNSTVTLHFRNHLGQEQPSIQQNTDTSGNFSLNYTAPLDKPIGTHTWWAVDDATGGMSDVIRYQITGDAGTQASITQDQTTPLESVYIDLPYGILTSEGGFAPGKETFVIVHGWNIYNTTEKPLWMTQLGQKIVEKGANVLYWNWQEKAKTKITDYMLTDFNKDESCIDIPVSLIYPPNAFQIEDSGKKVEIPYDETNQSGKYLAVALKKALPTGYGQNIHFVGHSLGTLVTTYAAKYAKDKGLAYAGKINHLVFLDSPCYGGIPGGKEFLNNLSSSVFWENYMSELGRPYKDADANVWLQPKAIGLNPSDYFTAHGYSHEWYTSSVTNFDDREILGDSSIPSSTMPWGFYWWKVDNRIDVASDYSQTKMLPHYLLDKGNAWDKGWDLIGDIVIDVTGAYVDASVEMKEQIEAWAKLVGKTVKIVGIQTYTTATDVVGAVVDTADHAFYNSTYGFLNLIHSSTAVLDLPVTIPAEANALSFGTEFLYSDPGSILEVFINGNLVYHATSDQTMTSGLKMIPWIGVKEFAGQTATLSLRLSNPNENTEGKIRIDDLVLAKIEDPDVPDGDVNNDGSVNLTDTILALQIVSGQKTSNKIYPKAEVNSDSRIGTEEAIYSLQKAAGLE